MIHTIGDYLFDSDRLILYKADISKSTIKALNDLIPSNNTAYDEVYTSLMKLNPDAMCMKKYELDSCGIIPSYNCNLRCKYCAYSSNESNKSCLKMCDVKAFIRDIIKKRTIKKLVTKSNDPLHFEFTGGGEPTYDWDLFVNIVECIIFECRQKGIPYHLGMTTNGILSDDQIDFIGEHFKKLMVSYDGLPKIQNRNRISPTHKNTSSIVEHTIQRLSQKDIELTVRTTICQSDYSEINNMYHHISSILPTDGKIIWSIWPVQPEGRATLFTQKAKNQETKEFLDICMNLKKQVLSNCSESKIRDIELPIFANSPCEIFCGAISITRIWLLPDGSLTTCVESPIGRVTIGKVVDGKTEYYTEYNDILLRTTQKKYAECRDCIAYHFCKGGCPMWHLREEKSGNIPQECALQIEYVNYIIELALKGDFSMGWSLTPIELPDIDAIIYRVIPQTRK